MNRLKNLLKRHKGDKDQDKKKGENERRKGYEDEEEVEEKGDDLISKLADETAFNSCGTASKRFMHKRQLGK